MTKHFILLICISIFYSCNPGSDAKSSTVISIPADQTHFIPESLEEKITIVPCKLSDRTEAKCYKIITKSLAHEHKMGPWCPQHISDSKDKGGIWFDGGKVYDVDGHFISNIATFYKDEKWKLYNDDGSIKVTNSREACEGAAKPRVEEIYKNHCVECQPSYYNHTFTYYLPINPSYKKPGQRMGRNPLGLAFNGVNFDPPAPMEMILKAHTLAPLDDCGGHVNPHVGYHYHAASGCTKEITQSDGHAPMIGYALDGFGIFGFLDTDGKEAMDLDPCRGHEDEIRGYHYHAGNEGRNLIISCLSGAAGRLEISH